MKLTLFRLNCLFLLFCCVVIVSNYFTLFISLYECFIHNPIKSSAIFWLIILFISLSYVTLFIHCIIEVCNEYSYRFSLIYQKICIILLTILFCIFSPIYIIIKQFIDYLHENTLSGYSAYQYYYDTPINPSININYYFKWIGTFIFMNHLFQNFLIAFNIIINLNIYYNIFFLNCIILNIFFCIAISIFFYEQKQNQYKIIKYSDLLCCILDSLIITIIPYIQNILFYYFYNNFKLKIIIFIFGLFLIIFNAFLSIFCWIINIIKNII